MVTPLNIDNNNLTKQLESEYGIKVQDVTFLPQGEVSWGYKIECLERHPYGAELRRCPGFYDKTYFLKIHKSPNLAPICFQLLYDLHTKAEIDNIIYPKLTREKKLRY